MYPNPRTRYYHKGDRILYRKPKSLQDATIYEAVIINTGILYMEIELLLPEGELERRHIDEHEIIIRVSD